MKYQQREKLQREADFQNKKYEKEGSDKRLMVTDDLAHPFMLVDFLKNECMPHVSVDEKLKAME